MLVLIPHCLSLSNLDEWAGEGDGKTNTCFGPPLASQERRRSLLRQSKSLVSRWSEKEKALKEVSEEWEGVEA